MKNKNIPPAWTLTIGLAAYAIRYLIFGDSIIGDSFALIGFICVILAIVGLIETAVRNRKKK